MQYHLTTPLFFFFLLLLLTFSVGLQPADKGANAKTKATLDFIGGLPKQNKYLSGQFAGWSKVTFNLTQINEIESTTGHIPALIGCDYAAGWATGPPPSQIDYSCNQYLKDYSDKHGIIQVENHFPNPVFPDGGGLKNKSDLIFTDLLKPETETGKRWRLYIDAVAQGLNDLQQSNVTALYRPFHEMNGGWFWWGAQNPTEFHSVWQSLFNYFSNEKNLHNLLWVYAPDQGPGSHTLFYPGDDFVDIVALDVYVNDPYATKGYDDMIKLNKPFALGEVGPLTPNGSFDYSLWPTAIQNRFTLVSYFHAWNDMWSPIREKNAYALYNNPHVVNRDQI